jgi:hypothetical protein
MAKPTTDWEAIRALLNAAIDACEAVDRLGIGEDQRDGIAWRTNGVDVSVADFLASAWTYPENVEHELIRLRHRLDADAAYVDPLARTLMHVARAASQLVGARDVMQKPVSGHSLASVTRELGVWYTRHFAAKLTAHARRRRAPKRPKMTP